MKCIALDVLNAWAALSENEVYTVKSEWWIMLFVGCGTLRICCLQRTVDMWNSKPFCNSLIFLHLIEYFLQVLFSVGARKHSHL